MLAYQGFTDEERKSMTFLTKDPDCHPKPAL